MLLYFLILGGTILLSLGASALVKSAFAAGQRVPLASGLTGAEIARRIARHHDLDCEVVETEGVLSDHYNPATRTLALSRDVFHGRTAAAAGVAAHEVGHAIQHATGDLTMWMRSYLAPAAGLGSGLAPWIIFAGAMLGGFGQLTAEVWGLGAIITLVGISLFGAFTLFTLVTVPNEFNASHRARLALLDMGIIRPGEEEQHVGKVLTAAGLTYVAAAVTAVAWLLYYLLPLLLNRDE